MDGRGARRTLFGMHMVDPAGTVFVDGLLLLATRYVQWVLQSILAARIRLNRWDWILASCR